MATMTEENSDGFAHDRDARSFGLTENELLEQALRRFLLEKRREVLQERLELLARYGVQSVAELEARIANGTLPEHPAWEDLITTENLESSLTELDEHLRSL